jgi:hypothetical protein
VTLESTDDHSSLRGVPGLFSGGGTVHVLVVNNSSDRDVGVTATFYDSAGNSLGGESRVVEISEEESRLLALTLYPKAQNDIILGLTFSIYIYIS